MVSVKLSERMIIGHFSIIKKSDSHSTQFSKDSEDVMANDVRRQKVDRRKKYRSEKERIVYDGPERRSGKERRIWVDRIQEIWMKMDQKQG